MTKTFATILLGTTMLMPPFGTGAAMAQTTTPSTGGAPAGSVVSPQAGQPAGSSDIQSSLQACRELSTGQLFKFWFPIL